MKLSKFLQVMFMVTILSLTYIHMQMQIFDLAYQGKTREGEITHLLEDSGRVAYQILELKSSNHIGDKLLTKDSSLQFRDNGNVVQLVTSEFVPEEEVLAALEPEKMNPFFNFFSLKAEAKTRVPDRNSAIAEGGRIGRFKGF